MSPWWHHVGVAVFLQTLSWAWPDFREAQLANTYAHIGSKLVMLSCDNQWPQRRMSVCRILLKVALVVVLNQGEIVCTFLFFVFKTNRIVSYF